MRLMVLIMILIFPAGLFAAVGCDLNDPDRDVKRLFQNSTGFKTSYVSISRRGGEQLLTKIEQRLGDKFKGLYETADVPYTIYEIYKNNEKVGYIHGVNQKGKYGGIQVFVSLDLEGTIISFYFQKLTSRQAKLMRNNSFATQFRGLSLKEFYQYDVTSGKLSNETNRISLIKNPAPSEESDFRATLRAVKKNLILMDEFVFTNRHIQYFKPRSKE